MANSLTPMEMKAKLQAFPMPRRIPFWKLFWGKKVAVVGNAPVEKDLSQEIDGADLVVRFNHFYNYDSGKVGKRVDIVIQTPTDKWVSLNDAQKHVPVLRAQRPRVVSIKYADRMRWEAVGKLYTSAGCEMLEATGDWGDEIKRLTTGGMFLALLAEYGRNYEARAYGFSGRDFLDYIEKDGRHYMKHYLEEVPIREKAIAQIKASRITESAEFPFRVVIPARKGSSRKDKNIEELDGVPLLARAVEKWKRIAGGCIVLTDSERYAEVARGAGAEVPYIDREIRGDEDVVAQVRRWLARSDFCGNVIIAQCVAPYLSEETARRFVAEARLPMDKGEAALSVVPAEWKASAYFVEDAVQGAGVNLSGISPSKPRQAIPPAWRFTGGACLVNWKQLAGRESLFDGCEFRLIKAGASEGLDID